MKACCCSLAGTRACDNCRSGPSEILFNFKPVFWTSSDVDEKTKNKKSK